MLEDAAEADQVVRLGLEECAALGLKILHRHLQCTLTVHSLLSHRVVLHSRPKNLHGRESG
jgi:hypothetical protein